MKIGNRNIGESFSTYVIAEAGINHNGSLDLAKKLVDAAVDAGAHAVKFQKRDLPSLYPEDMLLHPEKYEQSFQYMLPLLQRFELSEEDYVNLRAYAEEKPIDFICTPFDIKSAKLIYEAGIHAFKIASADLTNYPLLDFVASKDLPIIISTGMSYKDEIKKTVHFLNERRAEFAILHCRSAYPVWPRDVNLKMINWLKQFNKPVGYSGHDIGLIIPLVAASMGACIIEKHLTLDPTMEGTDHKISLDPYSFKRLVRDIEIADQAMGHEKRFLLRGEVVNREVFGKSLAASEDIPKGSVITEDKIAIRGPGKGLPTSRQDELVGKRANRHIHKNSLFYEDDLEEDQNDELLEPSRLSFKSKWGLITRFSDFEDIIAYDPEIIEIHLAEKDFGTKFIPTKKYEQELIVHAPEYIHEELMNLCSFDEDLRKKSVALVQETIILARELAPFFKGTPKIVAHPGAMSMKEKLNKSQLREALLKSVSEIDHNGVELLLENMPPYPWFFGGEWKGNYFMAAEEIVSICKETGLNIVFDLSHAAMYCNAKDLDLYKYIETVLPFTRHLHLADAYGLDGEGVQFGEGDIDLDKVMPVFSSYRGSWVPEIWRGHLNNGRGFLKAISILAQYIK
ncbi:N-acetylneuraminate synthase family protein [Desulfamplus magnetovallimortis]|nr:N-acetylneuraminate synthase family protein [Desulfamplus magnetovallimortis]